MRTVDPVADHIAELERSLRGPARARRSMIAEARAGLEDAADAYRECGLDAARAAARAVRDFGGIPEVAPQFQEELTARQGRRNALLLAVVFPAMLFGWDLLASSGMIAWKPGPPAVAVVVLAKTLDAAAALVAVAALVLLAATFRRTMSPRRVTAAVGLTGMVGSAVCSVTCMAMNLVDPRATVESFVASPVALAVFAGSMGVVTVVVRAAVRTLRVARWG
ncbi:permease prefix domain 1-containing protein [Pseudonocardia nigra]|uniref:permease prefix domain 1-containing protein n=1 Tax=Pseudonocardia nigra TaxID=1921578 RepID=UPI001C5D29A1|nr:permease prefix domain 1-containing protein [Pseudonocardia nigra]